MMRRALAIASLLGACGAQAFDPQFAERQEPALDTVMADLAAAPAREAQPVIAAVTRSPAGLLLWDLREARERWRVEADVRSTPIVAGEYVVTAEGDGVVVRSLADGARVHTLDDPHLHLVGADGEGRNAVVALARREGESPLGFVVGIHDGAAAWSHDLPLPVGVPAAVGNAVVIPWGHQRLSILDAVDGAERLRLHLEHMVLGHAFHHGARVYVGQHRFVALRSELFDDEHAQHDGLEPRGRPLPGQPPILPDAYVPRMEADGAGNRVRLAWAFTPPETEPPGFADDALYFVFYRLVFGLAADADDVRWTRAQDRDVVGVDALPGGLVVVSDDGHVAMLAAADGREIHSANLGVELRAADVRAEGFVPPAAPDAGSTPAGASLADQLWTAASLEDVRLGGGRALAIRFLARDDSAEVTEELIALCSDRSDSSQARGAACDELAERISGGPAVLTALHAGASFLEETPAPPIGALARAAASMHLRQAVPFLVQHLEDPSTPIDELVGVFTGLADLGDARAVAPIERFVRLYHADATDAPTLAALGAAAQALVALDADRTADVQAMADDPLAPEPARQRLALALAPPPAAAPTPDAPAPPPPRPTRPPPPPPPDETLPVALDSELIETALAPVSARLLRCLDRPGDADPYPSARIMIMVDDDGAIQTVSVTPADLQGCVEPLVRTRSMPRTRRGDEVVIHTLRR